MLSFRSKIFISYLIVFLVFIAIVFPFSSKTVKRIVYSSMQTRSQELISKIKGAATNDELVRGLKDQKPIIFFRVAIITDEQKVLYDSHLKRLLGPRFSQEYVVEHPEVLQALKNGIGYNEEYSDILGQKFVYIATAFDFHDKTYVLRSAFPYKYVTDLTRDFEIGFVVLSIAILLLFSTMTWLIIHHLSSPIQQIITDIKPYQEGRNTSLPAIQLKNVNPNDDFGRLAMTLNSLSEKIQGHIDSVVNERDEKEAVLESLVEGVIAIDEKMSITYANAMALKLLGMRMREILRDPLKATEKLPCYELIEECQNQREPLSGSWEKKKNGQHLYINVVVAPKRRGGAIMVLQDVTLQNKILEMRQAFIANASHELKTPITIIQGFAETLQDHPDLPKETIHTVTEKIVRNCVKMTNTIKDLLALADIENLPDSRIHEVNLVEIIEKCSEHVVDAYPDSDIQLKYLTEDEWYMNGDSGLLEQAFANLIENAAKYSDGPAHITIFFDKDSDDRIKLEISDKGIGIPEQHVEHIFQRFYTVDKKASKSMGGSGLGLSIVETIIDKHFGKITCRSKVGEGTTFTILLPTDIEKMI